MKVAICLSGQCRLIGQWPTIKEKLFSCLPQADYFVHFWEEGERKGHQYTPLRGDHLEHVLDLFKPIKHLIEPQKQVQQPGAVVNFNCHSMLYSLMISNDLKKQYEDEHNFKYDCVIRVRTDFGIKDTLELSEYSDLDHLHVRFLAANDITRGVNDQFAFGNSAIMDRYADCYNHMKNPHMIKWDCPEVILARYIDDVAKIPRKEIKQSLFWW